MSAARFADRAVYITGAASGVGEATAKLFAAEGAKVFAVDVNDDGIRSTIDQVRAAGGTAEGGHCDVSSMDSVQASIDEAVARFNGLDILLNVAGVGRSLRFEDLDDAEWDRVMGVNLKGVFHTTRAALPYLMKDPVGNIVNVASGAGLRGHAYIIHYAASKAAVISFTRSIALEFASRGLRSNCVCPGGIISPFLQTFQPPEGFEPQLLAYYSPPTPELMSMPEDVAMQIAFLASDDARRVNGASLVGDGGTMA